MKMITYIFCPLLFLLFSCQPDDQLSLPGEKVTCMEHYDGPLNILWSTLIRSDSAVANSFYPVILDNQVLFNELYFNKPNTIYSFDPHTGKKQWAFKNFPWESTESTIQFNNPTQNFEDRFYFNYGTIKALFNAQTRQIEFSTSMPYSNPRVSAGHENLYAVQYNASGILRDSELKHMKRDGTGSWKTIYKRAYQDGEAQGFELPAEWISPDNETYLIFRNYRLPDIGATRSNILAYNVTRDRLEWEVEDINEVGVGTIHLPIIRDDKAYITNSTTLACIDIPTGNVVWKTSDLGTSFFNSAPVLSEDRIIIHGDDGTVVALWLDSGVTSWRKNDSNFNPTKMEYYKGAVYYCTNDPEGHFMYGLKADGGQVIFKEGSPNVDCQKLARLAWGLSVDQNTGVLYTHDGFFAMAIQLDEY